MHWLNQIALRKRIRSLRGESLEARHVLDAQVVISEFMAVNTSTLRDDDNQFVPWIELRNIGDTAQSLAGWHLTNSTDDLDRWTFPSVTLAANQQLLVYASGKNRASAGSPLHTNFSLAESNGSLSLVRPDGISVAHQFAAYPVQVADVSFGIGTTQFTAPLLSSGAAAKYRVPAGPADLPIAWTSTGFNDSAWSPATSGLGFDVDLAAPSYASVVLADNPLHYYRFEETSGTVAKDEIGAGANGSQPGTYTGGITLAQPSASPGLGRAARFSGASGTYVNLGTPFHPGNSVTTEAWVYLDVGTSKAFNSIVARWDGSYELNVDGSQGLVNFNTRSGSNAFGQSVSNPFTYGQWHHVVGIYDATTGRNTLYLDGIQGSSQIVGGSLQNLGTNLFIGATRDGAGSGFTWKGLIDEVAIYNRPLSPGEISEHYNLGRETASAIDFTSHLSTNIEAAMLSANASVAVRLPFTVNQPAALNALTLRMKYDDGFVVYLNGQEVARRSAPTGTLPWNAAATLDRDNAAAIVYEEIDISSARSLLNEGPNANILAIHGLNLAANQPDFLLVPELFGTDDERLDVGGPGQYFDVPTPNARNSQSSPGVRRVDLVTITEIMASNDGALLDEDGDQSDWIELHNAAPYAVDLNNSYLTNDALDLTGWRFPRGSVVAPRGYLVVFSSGKDRNRGELHTDFRLNDEGEYLALVKPDGITVVSQFNPTYPTQFPNVSYGRPDRPSSHSLVSAGAAGQVRVPTQAAHLPANWNAISFNDTDWSAATTGIGFDQNGGSSYGTTVLADSPVHYWRMEETSTSQPAADQGAPGGNPGTYIGGVALSQPSVSPALGSAVRFDGAETAPNGSRIDVGSFYPGGDVTVEAWVMLDPASTKSINTVAARWDGSWELDVLGSTKKGAFIVRNSAGQSGSAQTASALVPGQWHHLVGVFAGGVITVYLDGVAGPSTNRGGALQNAGPTPDRTLIGASRTGSAPGSNNWTGLIDEVAVYSAALNPARIAAHIAVATSPNLDLNGAVSTNVAANMQNASSVALLRIPFTVANAAALDQLTLRMKYDDGFVAYINGQEVARRNAPGLPGSPLTYQTAATAEHPDIQALAYETIDLSPYVGALQTGNNLLAIAGLNQSATDSDFLIVPELTALDFNNYSANLHRYFVTPTPGAANSTGSMDQGSVISEVAHTPGEPTDQQDLVVTARVTPLADPTAAVTLHYRVMYGAEVGVTMLDNGIGPDVQAGDSIYTGVIPASVSGPGEMVRYYVTALDSAGDSSRWPLFMDPAASAEYLGTVVVDPATTSQLPIFQWFVQNPSAADSASQAGTRASVYYRGEFYDNVFVRTRGATAISFPKRPYKFDFNKGHYFQYDAGLPRVSEININTTFQDKALVRAPLTFETYADAGVPSPDAFNLRVERNGEFFSVAVLVEQIDETFLERRGLDPDGVLYKFPANGLTSATSGVEKRTHKNEPNTDLAELVSGLALNNPNRGRVVLDEFDVPALVNYLAVGIVTGDADRAIKNYYLFLDQDGDELWQVLPWDKDLTFGLQGLASDSVHGNNDSTLSFDHPFVGATDRNCCGVNNLFDAVYDTPVLRQMVVRRLRTMMDEYLQPPGTPAAELRYEQRLNELYTVLQADAALDLAKWGAGFGSLQSLATAMNILKTNYLAQRRTHLYQTHSIDNVANYPAAVSIPHAQTTNPAIHFGQIEHNPASGNQDQEFIELVNPHATAVDISGWKLTGGVAFTFDPGTVIPAQSSLYVSPDVRDFKTRTAGPRGGQGLLVVGPYASHLSNFGETIQLQAADDSLLATASTPAEPTAPQLGLRITELMYHPSNPTQNELEQGYEPLDESPFEFVELQNVGATPLDLSTVSFTTGVEFEFSTAEVNLLQPGERVLVVGNRDAFEFRYGPGLNIAGEFSGNLSNGGERIQLDDLDGGTIQEFVYDDVWHPSTDGPGPSLVVVDPLGAVARLNFEHGWRPSANPGGSPGSPDVTVSTVVGRHVFYNASKFDGNNASANENDDLAIDTSKAALLPTQTSTFANYTSYNRGLNGIMVDIADLPASVALSPSDFEFKVGNSDTPSAWTPLAAAPTISVRPAPNLPGTSRVTLLWPTGAAIKQWLQITIKANANTHLAAADVFYFGNAVGESGNVPGDYGVSITDELLARNNPVSINPGTLLTNRFDFNRDGTVSVVDQLLARNNITTAASRLKQVTVPGSLVEGEGASRGSLAAEAQVAIPGESLAPMFVPVPAPLVTLRSSDARVALTAAISAAPSVVQLDPQALASIYDDDPGVHHRRRPSKAAPPRPDAGLLSLQFD